MLPVLTKTPGAKKRERVVSMIKQDSYDKMSATEQMLYDAHSLLEEISNDFMLLAYYPYLDEDRSNAMEMERRIKEFLKRPLFDVEESPERRSAHQD